MTDNTAWRVNRQMAIQGLIVILLIVNFALLLRSALAHQCPEILAPEIYSNGQVAHCVKDPSSTASRIVWNCT